jgi:hypothetical protein
MFKFPLFSYLLQKRLKRRVEGYVFLTAVLLSALVITAGTGLTRIITKEVQFTQDLFFSEKAYYAAESAVEIALLELKEDPVENINEFEVFNQSGAVAVLNIGNQPSAGFSFSLPPNATTKLRLRLDADSTRGTAVEPIDPDFTLNISPLGGGDKVLQWKIVCSRGIDDKTTSIQDVLETGRVPSLKNLLGIYDDVSGNSEVDVLVSRFLNLPDLDKTSCFLSFTNLQEIEALEIAFEGTDVPPPKAKIVARGMAGKRQKTIVFEYAQKNLSSFFDFGLFHSDSGFGN